VVSERRIVAAKPARLRRDVAGFGPVQDSSSPQVAIPEPDSPIVRVVLVPADEDPDGEDDLAGEPTSRVPDWRYW